MIKRSEKIILEVTFDGKSQPEILFNNATKVLPRELRFVENRLFYEWKRQRKLFEKENRGLLND